MEPLVAPESGFMGLSSKFIEALEGATARVETVLESECHDLFSTATTRVFSYLYLREPSFNFGSVICPVDPGVCAVTATAVEGAVKALMKKFACVAVPSPPPTAAGVGNDEDSCSDVDDELPVARPSGGASSS